MVSSKAQLPVDDLPSSPLSEETIAGIDSIQSKLEKLRWKVSKTRAQEITVVLEALNDIITTSCFDVVSDGIDSENEAAIWCCFAKVYSAELELYKAAKGKDAPVSQKRQIFADILVWAEVKRSSYDQQTASFVTDPHDGDPSFVRIGEALSKALAEAEVSL